MDDKGILTAEGEVNLNKINLMTGVIALPFTRLIYESCAGHVDVINEMESLLSGLYYARKYQELYDSLKEMFSDMGYAFSKDIELLSKHPAALEYFLRSFLLDLEDIMQDYKVG